MARRVRFWLTAAGVWASCGAAFAGSDTDPFTVTANVVASCNVNANDLAFGAYDPVSAAPLDAATTIEVTCTNGADYEVALNAGLGAGATTAVRKMTSGADLLNYALYSDAGRSNVWGENADNVDGTGTGAQQTLNVYGRVPVNQTAPEGAYADTVTVTVAY